MLAEFLPALSNIRLKLQHDLSSTRQCHVLTLYFGVSRECDWFSEEGSLELSYSTTEGFQEVLYMKVYQSFLNN